jgi:hypothetical protein
VVSWIVPASKFVLQANGDLSTENWLDVPAPATLNPATLQNEIRVLRPLGNRFYRLVSR